MKRAGRVGVVKGPDMPLYKWRVLDVFLASIWLITSTQADRNETQILRGAVKLESPGLVTWTLLEMGKM
jgi:hypothetical protein